MKFRDLVMLGVGMMCGGLTLHRAVGEKKQGTFVSASRYEKLDLFASVLSYIENDYVENVNGRKIIYGAIRGMLRELDPYTMFIPAEQYKEIKSETSGEYGGPGVGIYLDQKKNIRLNPYLDSPAIRAGIRASDILVRIGSKRLVGMSLSQIRRLLRGRPGTHIQISVLRKGWAKEKKILVIREQIRLKSVFLKKLVKGIFSIRITSFQDRTTLHMKEALKQMQGSDRVLGLVLDLRGNPGGLFDQSVRFADLFLEKGLIVSAKGRQSKKVEREFAHKEPTWKGFPMIVLVNKGTASASEIVAGALQDYRRAVILGEVSFGKGSVQTIVDLADGSGLKMTVARYYTPLGRLIHGRGIQPDVLLSRSNRVADNQLRAAIDLLKNKKKYQSSLGKGLPISFQKKNPISTGS